MKILMILVVLVYVALGNICPPKPTPEPPGPPPPPPPPPTKTLVVDRMVVNKTPQSGTWLMCFMANADSGNSNTFNIPNRTYSGDGITIPMNLEIGGVRDGERISFAKYLDDDQADVCADSAEDKSNGDFTVSSSGSKSFSFDNWQYTVYWKTK